MGFRMSEEGREGEVRHDTWPIQRIHGFPRKGSYKAGLAETVKISYTI